MSGSAQNTNYPKILFKKSQFKEAIDRFSYFSVRDVWTQSMIQKLSNGKLTPVITPDPVFAFNQNVKTQFSKEYIMEKFGLDENYVLVSVDHESISAEWEKQVEVEFAKKTLLFISCLKQINQQSMYCLIGLNSLLTLWSGIA